MTRSKIRAILCQRARASHMDNKRRNYMPSVLALIVMFFWLSCNFVWLNLTPPGLLYVLLGCTACFIIIKSGPTNIMRIVGVFVTLIAILSALYRLQVWREFDHSMKTYASFVSSLSELARKMDAYRQVHPQASPTNLAEYISAGAVTHDDTNFLGGGRVVLWPRGADNDVIMEFVSSNRHTTLLRNGVVQETNDK
jgi:hypothetical protein